MRIPFFSWLFDSLIKKWEIPDTYKSNYEADAIAGFTIAQLDNGKVGSALQSIIVDGFFSVCFLNKIPVIVSNDFTRNGKTLTNICYRCLREEHFTEDQIKTADNSNQYNKPIRNTYEEAIFHICMCKNFGYKKVVIVANHIHMRRCIAALRKAMKTLNYKVEIVTKSVGRDSYGLDASYQKRFLHPYLFFCYELLIYPYSKLKKWW